MNLCIHGRALHWVCYGCYVVSRPRLLFRKGWRLMAGKVLRTLIDVRYVRELNFWCCQVAILKYSLCHQLPLPWVPESLHCVAPGLWWVHKMFTKGRMKWMLLTFWVHGVYVCWPWVIAKKGGGSEKRVATPLGKIKPGINWMRILLDSFRIPSGFLPLDEDMTTSICHSNLEHFLARRCSMCFAQAKYNRNWR